MKSPEEYEAHAIESISRNESLDWTGKEMKVTIFDVVRWAQDYLCNFRNGPIDCSSHLDSIDIGERMAIQNLLDFIFGE